MVVLGVVLVLLAFAVGVLLVAGVASLEGTIVVSVPGGTLSFPPLTFLVTGMVVISVFWLGWVVLRTGVRHSRRRRAEAKEAAKEAEAKRVAEEQRLKEEFAARERQLIEERRRHDAETAELTRGASPGTASTGEPGSPTRDDAPGDPRTAAAPTSSGPGTGDTASTSPASTAAPGSEDTQGPGPGPDAAPPAQAPSSGDSTGDGDATGRTASGGTTTDADEGTGTGSRA